MQDTLLRVFVVAVGLLTCPRDDPVVQRLDDITPSRMQKHQQRLMGGGNKLDNLMEPVNEEMTHTDSRGPPGDKQDIRKEKNPSAQHVTEGEHISHLGDVTALKGNSQLDTQSKQRGDVLVDGALDGPDGKQDQTEEKEETSSKEQESAPSHLHTKTSENETSEEASAEWEKDYLWYLWNTLSIISVIRFVRKCMGRNPDVKPEENRGSPVACTDAEVPLLDGNTLQRFHSKYVKISADNKWKEVFLEGFVDDLITAMRKVCHKSGSMVIEDFQMLNACNVIVPIIPPDPCSFQCLLWNNQASDQLPDMQVCGQIKLVERKESQGGCSCQSPDADDMVCLLHCETERVKGKITDVYGGLLCVKNSQFLSKSQVTRWFQSTIKEAWAQISHKYEFELSIRYLDAPGALVVRFRSGKKISFSVNPVVRFNNGAHFTITPCSPTNLDTLWTLSLTNYENHFLKNISKHLPQNSCHSVTLEIAIFLHRRQTALLGSSVLMDFHFKTALMHLLLTSEASQWKAEHVAVRLQDLLAFMGRSLEKKQLHHVLVGNPLAQRVIVELPDEFTQAQTVNLFHPLVVHSCIYRNAVMHFQEMLKNAHMLIQEYVDQCNDNCSV
ncbi:inositol 1,4,5-trisphosphate receptor-interacting protein [Notolabrus celidotus]|uniref:inositol 1,4,5-trisphosphate receptor-interacting protein n=1 Tax=Notolabrus celidotus TaxID=1203425 RepID=UPI001490819F|nr:inositol 1,4,5-trisphosphate receptor-interacting protein [Notolabrus celidotus]